VQLLAHMYQDDPAAPTARWWLQACSVPEMSQHFMAVWDFWYASTVPAAPESQLHGAYHATGTGQVYARSSWDADATWVHLAAGPYSESHAHRDKGSIMFYRGEWLAYDQNVLSHSGIRQEEEMHNLVRIVDAGETVPQREGADPADLLALAEGDGWLYTAVDVTPIYDDHPAVDRVEREMVFIRPDVLVVFDRVDTSGASERVWQLNTPIQPTLAGPTATITGSRGRPSWSAASRRTTPPRRCSTGPPTTTCTAATASTPPTPTRDGSSRFLHVLSTDGAVMNATASHAGSQLGVELTLAGDGMARVRFEADAPGGELLLDGADPPARARRHGNCRSSPNDPRRSAPAGHLDRHQAEPLLLGPPQEVAPAHDLPRAEERQPETPDARQGRAPHRRPSVHPHGARRTARAACRPPRPSTGRGESPRGKPHRAIRGSHPPLTQRRR
jgi:hypothetical protein